MATPSEKIALLGFGDIARRLLPHLSGYDVSAVKRSPIETGANLVLADCRDQQQMNALMEQKFDVVVMSFVPTQYDDQGYKEGYVDTVRTVIQALQQQAYQPRLLIFVSSSGVYGQSDSSWVDEASPTEPKGYSGKRMLEAEALIAESGFAYSNVRFSGIYGPGRRRLIEQVVAGQGSPKEPPLYSNRIHAEDAAAILAHLIERQKMTKIAPCYLATDCEPVPLHEVKEGIAEMLGLPKEHLQEVDQVPGRMQRSSKRCSNKLLLDSGYQFRYPTFKEGYKSVIELG